MTGQQLRELRDSRNLTREQLAEQLGGCTAQAIVKWERDERPIPAWVEDKMFRSVQISLPLEELHELLDLARAENLSFEQLLAESLRLRLAAKKAV
jgi:transcriptional regulator with XRE-family HTH domain